MIISIILVALILVIFGILSFITKKYNRLRPSEIADIIEHFIEGKGLKWEWDDFISSPINDRELDDIRIRCSLLRKEFPSTKSGEYTNEEGIKILKQLVKKLREKEINKQKNKHEETRNKKQTLSKSFARNKETQRNKKQRNRRYPNHSGKCL